jgi:imidazolonepropionase|tara:strand:+ start:134 stop:1345 length:1212 start_codon:yes stop_codon:yes gene_type:complete
MYDIVLQNATILSYNERGNDAFLKGSVLIRDGNIIDIVQYNTELTPTKHAINCRGKLLTPGLIDCHTHTIYSGNRAEELEERISGLSYKKIAERGGGILSTVDNTREATYDQLYKEAASRVYQMMHYGTTTCEIKSGYGLDIDTEVKMLRIAEELNQKVAGITIIKTLLAAHAIPREFMGNKKEYIQYIIHEILPIIVKENLADFIDGFCEEFAFSRNEIKIIYTAAAKYGLKYKLHAEQLSYQGGAVMASEMNATSVDHLEYLKEEDCKILKKNNTVAVLLPGAFYYLKEKKLPPIDALLCNNVDIAIATDHNPGSSPFLSLPLMMNMACVLFGLTPHQAFKGVTINAAKALALDSELGSITIGKKADLVLWDCIHYNQIITNPTFNYRLCTIKNGQIYNNV